MKKQLLALTFLLAIPTISYNTDDKSQIVLTQEEQEHYALLYAIAHQLLDVLANPDISDEQIVQFARKTFDNASVKNTEEEILTSLFILHQLIHAFDYVPQTETILYNLERIAKISTNKHVGACTMYIKQHALDLRNPDLFN